MGTSAADDTDIYMNKSDSLPSGSEPIIIFSLDYRPNLTSQVCQGGTCDELFESVGFPTGQSSYDFYTLLRAALKKVFDPLTGVKIGLMLNHNSENKCAGPTVTDCSNGGYIAMGAELFDGSLDGTNAKQDFDDLLAAIPLPQGNVSHLYQGKELFFELYRYLAAQAVYNGHNGWNDYGLTNNGKNLDQDGAEFAWDKSIESGGDSGSRYESPLSVASQCTSIYTVNVMFGVSSQEDDSNTEMAKPVAEGGLGDTPKSFTTFLRYLNDADLDPDLEGKQNITSFFIVPSPDKTTNGYAQAGGTGAALSLTEDPEELVETLQDILNQVLSVSTTFVAASVPVNVFNRAELLGSVYIALFQLDADNKPRWAGNVKKLRLSPSTTGGSTILVDALGDPAVSVTDGRIAYNALTFWTESSTLPVPDPDATVTEVAGRDGRAVARGGAGQQIPGFVTGAPGLMNGSGGRTLYYDKESGTGAGTLTALNADTTTADDLMDDLGVASQDEALTLLKYARGYDVNDEDDDDSTDDARSWLVGDPLHSQPIAVNYGARGSYTTANPEVYLAVGSNDGFFRFIQNTTTGGAESGAEAWAFMPRSTMKIQSTLLSNGQSVAHPYGVDGSPAVYIGDSNHNGTVDSGEKVYVYFGLRRGGHAYYALDVSDPLNPSLLWTIEKGGDFAELGYTFSNPRIGLVKLGDSETAQPVVVFGGGYDTDKDAHTLGTNDTEGNAIYVVDAVTGDLIWKAVGPSADPNAIAPTASSTVFVHNDFVDSVPSTLTVADTDGDTLLDRILVGDTGGNVWRADLTGSDTSDWKLTRVANLGRHSVASATKADDRRFFHRPDIVPSRDSNGNFDGVLIGSGDRTDPLDKGGVVSNYFYMIKDTHTAVGAGADSDATHAALTDVTDDCVQESSDCTLNLDKGWKLQLENSGEKVLSTPVTIAGEVFFTSYLPPGSITTESTSCEPAEGNGRLYAIALKDARSVLNYDAAVGDDESAGGTTKSDRSTDLRSPGIPTEVVPLPPDELLRPDLQGEKLNFRTRWRTVWFQQEDADL
jgi:type IV pilus assembly protein PilY1